MRSLFISSMVLVSLAGCADAPPPPELRGRTDGIVDGERTRNDEPAVVAVLNRFGGLCTGTLIAPRVVLTAKHCVQNPGASGPNAPSAFIIGIGDTINRLTRTFGATDVVTTPGTYTDRGGLGGALVGIDVALITLASTVDGVTPIPVHRGDASALVGDTLRAVGFGQIPSGSAGTKYRTTTQISAVMGGVIYTPPTICQGDSGGPLLTLDGEVAGVASFGSGGCGTGINGYNRVDRFLDMIDEAVRASGVCVGDGTEVCDGEDNDCDDLFDEDCTPIGGSCAADDECVGTTCRDVLGTGRICTQACDPLRPLTGCPADMYCASAGGCEGFCAPGAPGAGALGSDCEADTDCISARCTDPGDGRRRCLEPCRGDSGMCLAGEACAAPAGACGSCVPAAIVAGARGLSEPCEEDADCASGMCIEDDGARYCSRTCSGDLECGDQFHCRVEEGETGLCIRGDRGGVGNTCLRNDDCGEGLLCAVRGEVTWCTAFCDDAEDCPPDFDCVDAGGAKVCAPSRGVTGAPCASTDECISGTCQPVGPDGAMVCTRLCGPGNLCETGFECRLSSDGVNAVCVPTVPAPSGGGGCATTSSAGDGLGLMLLALLALRRRER